MARPAGFNVTISSDIIEAMPSYLIRKPLVQNDHPRTTIVRRTIPVPVVVYVVIVPVVDDIIRATDRYRKSLGTQIDKTWCGINHKRGSVSCADLYTDFCPSISRWVT